MNKKKQDSESRVRDWCLDRDVILRSLVDDIYRTANDGMPVRRIRAKITKAMKVLEVMSRKCVTHNTRFYGA